ncbi:MAG: acetylglutamate kinase [Bacteroidia bacterium]|nr:acetylglutamate kinase [Bacteroidia bacterium]
MITVLKIGGKVLDNAAQLDQLIADFASLAGGKLLVHGGGKAATDLAARLGIEATMVDGRRITDDAMLEVVTMVYGGLMNKQVVAKLQALGQNAVGLTGADLNVIRAHKRPVSSIDYGWVGDIDQVDAPQLLALIREGILPVMAPLTHDGLGHLLNTNADTIASSVACALAADGPVRLVYSFEKPGVLSDPNDDFSVIPLITPSIYEAHKSAGIVSGGMIPKLDNAFDALQAGVEEVIICQASSVAHIGTESFVGTILRIN